jgi:hypothetical protein
MTFMDARDRKLVRQLSGGIAALVLVQVLLLQPHRMLTGTAGLLLCVGFGIAAFLAWLMTEARWPLVAWAIVVLFVAIDPNLQSPARDTDGFGTFADDATVPAPLLSAHAPARPSRDRFNRYGE